jgi:hypothetical protein
LADRKSASSRSGKRKPSEEEEEQNIIEQHGATAKSSLDALSEIMARAAAEDATARDLRDHASGFYEEVDKLAKGKAMLEVTDRALEETNLIIADAKRVVGSDPYLKRTHEFVAAGNNPVYPDVLFALRSVLQSLDRFRATKAEQAAINAGILDELKTILAAIALLSEGQESASKDQLSRRLGQAPNPKWVFSHGFNDSRFDFDKLMSQGAPVVKVEKRAQLALGSGE